MPEWISLPPHQNHPPYILKDSIWTLKESLHHEYHMEAAHIHPRTSFQVQPLSRPSSNKFIWWFIFVSWRKSWWAWIFLGKQWNIVSVILVVYNTCCWLFKWTPPRTLSTAHIAINLGVGECVLWILGFWCAVAHESINFPQRCQLGHWGVCIMDFGGSRLYFVCCMMDFGGGRLYFMCCEWQDQITCSSTLSERVWIRGDK